MLEGVIKAKSLKEQGVTVVNIESEVGIARAHIPKLIQLYEQMSNLQMLDDKSSEYVRIKKKRYLMKSIKMQHKMADIREMYLKQLAVLKNKRNKMIDYMESVEELHDLRKELNAKQKMLDVTSSNLQHAEDGYEYLKQEVKWNYLIFFMSGVIFVGTFLVAAKYAGFLRVVI